MKQQSEHLSNAQIEQYGKRASGAGPETEAWVDQHLDDCSSCRSRVLDFQRTRFALLPNPKVNKTSTSDCPSEDDLRNLAAGLYTDAKAAQLKAHVATCGYCGPLLQEYIEDFSDESSQEEQAFLAQLRTSSPKFREQKAKEMLKLVPTPVPLPSPRWAFTWRWALIPAAACALLALGIGGVTWYARRDTPGKAQKLLAQAAAEDRTMEMRIPYAKHSEFHQLRSGDSGSLLSLPEAYRKAGDQITAQMKKNPNDPNWLLVSAQFDLIHWDYLSALKTLNKIEDAKFKSSSQLLMIRALALYEQAEDQHQQEPYFESADLLGKVLLNAPNDPVALFNHAIVCERIESWQCAESDWNRLLTVETDRAWADEARERLKQMESKKKAAP